MRTEKKVDSKGEVLGIIVWIAPAIHGI